MSRQGGRLRRLEQRVDQLGVEALAVSAPRVDPSPSAAATNPWGSEWVRVRDLGLRHMNRWVVIPGSSTLEDEASRTAVIGVLVGIRPVPASARPVNGRSLVIQQGNQQSAFPVAFSDSIEVGDPA